VGKKTDIAQYALQLLLYPYGIKEKISF